MTNSTTRHRAPGMTPEQRREMIVQTALPLVAEYGSAVTTAQIARAAGIGEATIFRAFADKDELLQACVARALDPTQVLRHLRSIPLEQPLADRLIEAADALGGYLGRMGAVIGALHASGHQRRRPPADAPSADTPSADASTADAPRERSTERDASQAATREAVAELFEPDRTRLRLPVDALTDVFLGFVFGRGRFPAADQPQLDIADLVDLFLHGALSAPDPT